MPDALVSGVIIGLFALAGGAVGSYPAAAQIAKVAVIHAPTSAYGQGQPPGGAPPCRAVSRRGEEARANVRHGPEPRGGPAAWSALFPRWSLCPLLPDAAGRDRSTSLWFALQPSRRSSSCSRR
jgi:hypothetical protein